MKFLRIRLSMTGFSRGGKASRRARAVFVPDNCELEGRTLLSTFTVTNDHVSGPGSLPAEVALAANGGKIAFAPALARRHDSPCRPAELQCEPDFHWQQRRLTIADSSGVAINDTGGNLVIDDISIVGSVHVADGNVEVHDSIDLRRPRRPGRRRFRWSTATSRSTTAPSPATRRSKGAASMPPAAMSRSTTLSSRTTRPWGPREAPAPTAVTRWVAACISPASTWRSITRNSPATWRSAAGRRRRGEHVDRGRRPERRQRRQWPGRRDVHRLGPCDQSRPGFVLVERGPGRCRRYRRRRRHRRGGRDGHQWRQWRERRIGRRQRHSRDRRRQRRRRRDRRATAAMAGLARAGACSSPRALCTSTMTVQP